MLAEGADPRYASPGVLGFLVVFCLAVATWLLLRSMVGHLRKVRYSAEQAEKAEAAAAAAAGVTPGAEATAVPPRPAPKGAARTPRKGPPKS